MRDGHPECWRSFLELFFKKPALTNQTPNFIKSNLNLKKSSITHPAWSFWFKLHLSHRGFFQVHPRLFGASQSATAHSKSHSGDTCWTAWGNGFAEGYIFFFEKNEGNCSNMKWWNYFPCQKSVLDLAKFLWCLNLFSGSSALGLQDTPSQSQSGSHCIHSLANINKKAKCGRFQHAKKSGTANPKPMKVQALRKPARPWKWQKFHFIRAAVDCCGLNVFQKQFFEV